MGSAGVKWFCWILCAVLMGTALVWALSVAPTEASQGEVQRIFYFHLGSIMPGFIAFFYVAYASVRYLTSRNLQYDRRALVSGEIGLVYCTMVLITGPIWARPTWGVWWAWDARLSSTLVLWFMFLGYVKLREYMDEESQRARVSAVLGIIGACMVPFVYMSTRLFETQHPAPVIMGDEDSGIKDVNMQLALIFALAAFMALYAVLYQRGTELLTAEDRLKGLKAKIQWLEEAP